MAGGTWGSSGGAGMRGQLRSASFQTRLGGTEGKGLWPSQVLSPQRLGEEHQGDAKKP